jgi:hypothetical protein
VEWPRLLFPKPVVVINESGIAYDLVAPWVLFFRWCKKKEDNKLLIPDPIFLESEGNGCVVSLFITV